jgi:uncharacterized lipoprotein YddW (UPF0748 family)
MRRIRLGLLLFLLVTLMVLGVAAADQAANWHSYLPVAYREPSPTPTATPTPTPTPTATPTPPPAGVEFRGLWVTRFDWTDGIHPASSAKIDEIVQNAAAAGFNAILFQVRGSADAYYAPGLEPWAQRVSGLQVGQPPNPWWDPLAYFVNAAHVRGLQLHAYINVYPVWDECGTAPPITSPTHFYYLLRDYHGTTGGQLNGLQWDTSDQIHCSVYQRSSPASVYADNRFLAVAQDLVARYNIDGIHLDNIRYGGSNTSCDPVSEWAYGANCFADGGYAEWQRTQVNGTVWKFYDQIVPLKPGLWLSAAVWPVYIDYWGWGVQQGYSYYYQDSKAWVQGGYIDSIMPMIYPADYNNDSWTLSRWTTLVSDFQATNGGRYIIPGIGGGYDSFDEIANRIAAARAIGTAGHAIFSYGGLAYWGYFDDLAAGPYATPASVPPIYWHP